MKNISLFDFSKKHFPADKSPKLTAFTNIGSIYKRAQLFCKMKSVKSQTRTIDSHLEKHVACFYISFYIDNLVSHIKSQPTHWKLTKTLLIFNNIYVFWKLFFSHVFKNYALLLLLALIGSGSKDHKRT